MKPPTNDKNREDHQRTGHHQRRFVRMRMSVILAHERHEPGAEDVERGHARGDHADPVHPGRASVGGHQDRILTEEAGRERKARNRERRAEQA